MASVLLAIGLELSLRRTPLPWPLDVPLAPSGTIGYAPGNSARLWDSRFGAIVFCEFKAEACISVENKHNDVSEIMVPRECLSNTRQVIRAGGVPGRSREEI